VLLLVAVARMFWKRVQGIWEGAKDGAEILRHPWVYFTRVFFVEFLGWSAKLAVIGIFLASPSVSGRCSAVPAQTPFAGTFRGRDEFDKRSRGTADVLRGAVLDNKNPDFRGFSLWQSPLTDSNRRPPPYHGTTQATGRNRRQRFSLV
jgi:hypothetical protein